MKPSKVFGRLIEEIQRQFERLPDHRRGENTRYEIKDAAVSAFGIFFTQTPSFLAHQRMLEKSKGRSNVQSIFGVESIPSDAQVRNLLDAQEPEMLYEVFRKGHELLSASGSMEAFRSYDEQYLISCDGTGTVSSEKIHCPNCSQRKLSNGETLYTHHVILPVMVKAGESRVLVLEPEFISPQDGHEKQDCERAAIKRWVKRNADHFPDNHCTLLGDDLYACQPICELMLENGFNFILTCKPDSHVALYEQVEFLSKQGAVEEMELRQWNGQYYEKHQYRWVNGVPLRRGDDALEVNWCEITSIREDTGKQIYHNAWVTNHKLTHSNVVPIVRDGRARWKSENETNNVLKTKGYHLEHNFGHGKQFLANFMITLNLLAFLSHTILDLLDEQYHALRQELVARKEFFNDLRTLMRYMLFDNWNHLMHFMLVGLELIPDT
jgi:hypothetical protein